MDMINKGGYPISDMPNDKIEYYIEDPPKEGGNTKQ